MNPMNGATVNSFAPANNFQSLRNSRKQRYSCINALLEWSEALPGLLHGCCATLPVLLCE
jgi:hypothetical protein